MQAKTIHADQEYIKGLLANDSRVVQKIYKRFVPKVLNYVKQNSGSEQEARDIIQEVMVTIFNQASEKGLQLTCPFDAYFFLLCKRKWLNELKKSSRKQVTIDEQRVSIYDEAAELAHETSVFTDRQALYAKMFKKLAQGCKDIITASFEISSMEEVAKHLGVTYAYARKKKSNCIGELTKMIQDSPDYEYIQKTM